MLPTNTFLFLLLILPLSIAADDSSFLQPQDGISPFTSSYADDALLQPITDLGLNPEVLLAGIENNEVANCQGPPPGRRSRRSRLLRKRQTDFCSWQPFKSGAQTTTPPQTSPDSDKLGATGHDGAGTPLVPTTKKSPTDVKKPEEEGKSPIPIPLSGIGNPEICGPSKETIPVCHWSPRRESSRWSSPTLVLIPVRLYGPGDVCMGLEETWCCSSTSLRSNERLDALYPSAALLYPLAGEQCTFVTGRPLGFRNHDDFPKAWK